MHIIINILNFSLQLKTIYIYICKYLKRLIEMTERLINRMRWRAYHFLNTSSVSDHHETYGFNSKKTPLQVPELNELEDKMTNLIRNIEFKAPRPSEFQKNYHSTSIPSTRTATCMYQQIKSRISIR